MRLASTVLLSSLVSLISADSVITVPATNDVKRYNRHRSSSGSSTRRHLKGNTIESCHCDCTTAEAETDDVELGGRIGSASSSKKKKSKKGDDGRRRQQQKKRTRDLQGCDCDVLCSTDANAITSATSNQEILDSLAHTPPATTNDETIPLLPAHVLEESTAATAVEDQSDSDSSDEEVAKEVAADVVATEPTEGT